MPEKTETKPTLKFESEFLTKAILPQPTETSLGGEIKKGLLVRNGTQLTYALRKQYKSFRGLVGIADEATETGNATVTIEDEKGKVLWQQKMKQGEKPKPIELNLEEINRLLVKVNGSETGDLVVLNGRLLKMQDSIK